MEDAARLIHRLDDWRRNALIVVSVPIVNRAERVLSLGKRRDGHLSLAVDERDSLELRRTVVEGHATGWFAGGHVRGLGYCLAESRGVWRREQSSRRRRLGHIHIDC